MPELGPLGSVRGALSNEWPYRDLGYAAGRFGSSKLLHLACDLSDTGMIWRGENEQEDCSLFHRVLLPVIEEPPVRVGVTF